MKARCRRFVWLLLAVGVTTCLLSESVRAALRVSPVKVVLDSPETTQQLLVTDAGEDGQRRDLTRDVEYGFSAPGIAAIDAQGLIHPLAEGRAEILISRGAEQVRVELEVTGLRAPVPVSFKHDVIPILTKAGCNAGACHGKAEGKNGFKLSIFGFDAAADHDSLTKAARGRRIDPAIPEQSLLLTKATAQTPHGGGRRIPTGSLRYRRLRRWIAEGANLDGAETPPIAAIELEPSEQAVPPGSLQQLRVTAIDTAGNRRCATAEAEYSSNSVAIAQVDEHGLVQTSSIPGEAAILVRYMGEVAVCRVTLPRSDTTFDRPPEANFIDRLVWNKLQRLGIEPSGLADDATFLRRAFLDTIGMLPTADEARRFLTSTDPVKRTNLIGELLERDEYADYWAMRWADVLRVDQAKITPQGAVAMHRWLRRQFLENRPYDEFVRDIVTARGNTLAEGPASVYKVLAKPEDLSRSMSQLFLGVRIECAQCHHHPFEKWGQDDYYALAGFFTGVKRKGQAKGGELVYSEGGEDLKNPRSGDVVPARALAAPPADFSNLTDRRRVLADWMMEPDNPFFARVIVNRLWAHYFGRGLVEPIDDLRATNPATNEPLMAALALHLREVKYDLKAFTRTLLSSRVYQVDSKPNASNVDDVQNFSHATYKSLPAEVLLDAISQSTGVPEKFNGWPEGYRAVQIWDSHMPSYFFRVFGRPTRVSVCECERSNEPSIAQALHLMNSPEIMRKIGDRRGRARLLSASDASPRDVIDELYLTTLSRFPDEREQALMLTAFDDADDDRRAPLEDILWALLNSKDFMFNH